MAHCTTVSEGELAFAGRALGVGAVSRLSIMSGLPATLYTGQHFSADVSIMDPRDQNWLAAMWLLCTSPAYLEEVQKD